MSGAVEVRVHCGFICRVSIPIAEICGQCHLRLRSLHSDREVFVPDSLPGQNGEVRQTNKPQITHTPHAQRTAQFRQEAARIRESQHIASNNTSEAFPSLSESRNNSDNNLIGWSSQARSTIARPRTDPRSMTEENFPSLGGSGSSNSRSKTKKNATAKLRVAPTRSQQQTISINQNYKHSIDSFPSLGVPSSRTPVMGRPLTSSLPNNNTRNSR